MSNIVWSKMQCHFCDMAKRLLEQKEIVSETKETMSEKPEKKENFPFEIFDSTSWWSKFDNLHHD